MGGTMFSIVVRLEEPGQPFGPVPLVVLLKRTQKGEEGLVEPLTCPISLSMVGCCAYFLAPVEAAELGQKFRLKRCPSVG